MSPLLRTENTKAINVTPPINFCQAIIRPYASGMSLLLGIVFVSEDFTFRPNKKNKNCSKNGKKNIQTYPNAESAPIFLTLS